MAGRDSSGGIKSEPPEDDTPTLADVAGLPFLLAFYWRDIWAFKVWPVNIIAKQTFTDAELLTERDFVMRLYRMRRLVLAEHLRDKLLSELPTSEEAA